MSACQAVAVRSRAAVVVLGLLAGSGGGDAGDDGASPGPSPDASTTAASPTPSPTEEPSATVTPASGPLLRTDVAELNVPADWARLDPLMPIADTAGQRDGTSTITLSARVSFGSTLDELARLTMNGAGRKGVTRRLPDTELAGVPAYHIKDTAKNRDSPWWFDYYGAVYDDQVVGVSINLETDLPEAEREEIRDSVLASFRWK